MCYAIHHIFRLRKIKKTARNKNSKKKLHETKPSQKYTYIADFKRSNVEEKKSEIEPIHNVHRIK